MSDSDRLRLATRALSPTAETAIWELGNSRFSWRWFNGGGSDRFSRDSCHTIVEWVIGRGSDSFNSRSEITRAKRYAGEIDIVCFTFQRQQMLE